MTYQAAADGKDSFTERKFRITSGTGYKELWVKFDIFVPSNYYQRTQTSSANNKGWMHVWSGTYSDDYTGPAISTGFWPKSNGISNSVPYIKGPPLSGGGYLFSKHDWANESEGITTADRGKWLTIIHHFKYATAANNDGVLQVWKIRDGVTHMIHDIRDGAWYAPGQPGFDQGYLLGWANSGFAEETVFYIDNVEFSTTSLLGTSSGTSSTQVIAAPEPPSSVK